MRRCTCNGQLYTGANESAQHLLRQRPALAQTAAEKAAKQDEVTARSVDMSIADGLMAITTLLVATAVASSMRGRGVL